MQKTGIFCPAIARRYSSIMLEEANLAEKFGNTWQLIDPKTIWGITLQIVEVAKSATIPRSYVKDYHISDNIRADESVSSHTNLVSTLMDRFWLYKYGSGVWHTEDSYDYRDIMEATRRHDLAENETGDTADNGERDEDAKVIAEHVYQREFGKYSPVEQYSTEKRVRRLLIEMEGKTSPSGKALFAADKSGLICQALVYDLLGYAPYRQASEIGVTERDLQEIDLCDYQISDITDAYYASEMWTMDYLKIRSLVQYDETGFFTAIVVMLTLIVRQSWYLWREREYSTDYYS